MIIVVGVFDVEPADRDHFVESRRAQAAAARQEPGCVSYILSLDPFDAGRVHLFECWESQDAFGDHTRGIQAAGGPPSDVAVLSRTIRILDATDRVTG